MGTEIYRYKGSDVTLVGFHVCDRFGRYSASIMAVICNKVNILLVSCRILFQSVVQVSKLQGSVK